MVSLVFNATAADIWVSDEIEAPLKKEPTINGEIITLLKAGQKVEVLAESEKKDYTQIKTADGVTGWLSNYYVLAEESVHAQFEPIKAELSELKSENSTLKADNESLTTRLSTLENKNNELLENVNSSQAAVADNQTLQQELQSQTDTLQQKLKEQTDKIQQLTTALNDANKKANDASVQYLSLKKVSENVVTIDEQNRALQESTVQLEQQVQLLKNENQTLKSKLDVKGRLVVGGLIFGGLIVGYILAMSTPPRKRRNYPSKF